MPSSDPPNLSYEEQIRYEVERVRAEGCCSQCLTAILAHPDLHAAFQDEGEDGPIFAGELSTREYARMFPKYREPGAAWLHILGSLNGLVSPGLPYDSDGPQPASAAGVRQMIDTILSHHPDLDFTAGLGKLPPEVTGLPDTRDRVTGIARLIDLLLDRRAIEPAKLIDVSLVIEVGRARAGSYPRDWESPKRLEWWLGHFRWTVIRKFLATFRAQQDETIAPLAYAVSNVLLSYGDLSHALDHEDAEIAAWVNERRVPAELVTELAPYFAELLLRLDRRPENEMLLHMCWRYATWVHGHRPDGFDPAVRNRLSQMACDDLGRLRALVRQADSAEATEKFAKRYGAFGYYDDLLTYVCTFGSIWDALKPLVLAMRALSVPGVASDLRTWNEPGLEQLSVWSQIPNWAGGVVHGHARHEEKRDPRLEELRREFAAFCLERLKTGEKGGPVESSPVWRVGYIRAVRDLRVNPRGRGHHILHHARKNDPDPAVRAAADEAYKEMRHEEKLPEKRSPRRAVLGALWWLKRSHFIELRGDAALDQRGALRTRNRESRRTTEEKETDMNTS